MINIQTPKNVMQSLVGKKLQYVCRSCELVDFGFGKMFSRINSKGKKTEVASYSLHVLCPFRITNAHSTLCGSNDLYIPLSKKGDYVDLNIQNSCLFDLKVEYNQKKLANELVQEVKINKDGDVEICLSNICIYIFNANSTANESWRFFETGKHIPHLVSTGLGFEFE